MILVLESFAPAVSQRVIWVHSRQTPLGVARCVVIERGSLLTRPFSAMIGSVCPEDTSSIRENREDFIPFRLAHRIHILGSQLGRSAVRHELA